MLAEIVDVLQRTCHPELAGVIERADKALFSLGIQSHVSELAQIANMESSLGIDEVRDSVIAIYKQQINKAIELHAIKAESEDFSILIAIVEGLMILQNYEDEDSIDAICGSDDDAEGRLARLLGMVTEYNEEQFLQVITDVDESLLVRMRENIADEIQEPTPTLAILADETKKRIRQWIHLFPESFTAKLVASQCALGLPIEEYLDFLPVTVRDIMEKDVDVAATEIVGAVLLSDTRNVDVVATVNKIMDATFDDINFMTKVDIAAEKILNVVFSPDEVNASE